MPPRRCVAVLASLVALSSPVPADDVHVAVAANFAPVLTELGAAFAATTGHRVLPSSASTGKLYAQIRQGAPFAVLLSADTKHAALLEAEGRAIPGTRFTYATGQLVLWSPDPWRVDGAGQVLRTGELERLAMANPRLAPYGAAAMQVLDRLGLWAAFERKLVLGENIAQAFQFVASGAAPLGLVAASQIAGAGGSSWRVPPELYDPIEQQAILLREQPAARAFLVYLCSPDAQALIVRHGYGSGAGCTAAQGGH